MDFRYAMSRRQRGAENSENEARTKRSRYAPFQEFAKSQHELISWNIRAEIIGIAEEHGQKIKFTPPYYSVLQPIELVWAEVKGQVGRLYSSNTTLLDVKNRLMNQFERLQIEERKQLLQKIVAHADKYVDKYLEENGRRR